MGPNVKDTENKTSAMISQDSEIVVARMRNAAKRHNAAKRALNYWLSTFQINNEMVEWVPIVIFLWSLLVKRPTMGESMTGMNSVIDAL